MVSICVCDKITWRARERAWYCIRGLRPRSPRTTTQALPRLPIFVSLFCPSFSAIACNAEYRAWRFERRRSSVMQPPMVTYGWCRDSRKGLTTVTMRIEVVVIATLTVKVWWWWWGCVLCLVWRLVFIFCFFFSLNFGLIFNTPSIFYKCRYSHIRFCMSSNMPNHHMKDIMKT